MTVWFVEDGFDNVNVKTALVPSVTETSEIDTTGVASSSTIVPVPTSVPAASPADKADRVAVNVSLGSSVVSWVVGTATVTEVDPAGIVTVVDVVV